MRLAAEPGTSNYGRLSVFCQLCFMMDILALVPKEAFEPVPKVDSCIISLQKTGFSPDARTDGIIGALFSHRKKSVKNAVVDARRHLFGSDDRKQASEVAQSLKYADRKVFTLSPAEALEIAGIIVKM